MNPKIYFDNGSTSWPKAPQVASSMSELLESGAFNINRGNYEGAYELESLVLLTRMQLARLFHAPDSRHVIFTPVSYTHLDVYKRQLPYHRIQVLSKSQVLSGVL